MYRKQNRNPNKHECLSSKPPSSRPNNSHSAATPDNATSRIDYKPKFIKRYINIQEDLIAPTSHSSFNHIDKPSHSDTYIHSPHSLTEQNLVHSEHSTNAKLKWKDLYLKSQQELTVRTNKFNQNLDIFSHILKDMQLSLRNPQTPASHRLTHLDQQIQNLLSAFTQFDSDV